MWAVVGEGLGILPCANAAGRRLAGADVRSEPVGSVSGPRNDGSELFRGSPGDQRGPDGRSPRTSIAGAGSIGMRSYLRSEEHTSELQSLMRISYAVFCLKKK